MLYRWFIQTEGKEMQAQKLKQIMKRAMVLVLAAVSLFSAVFCAVPMTSAAQAASGTGLSCNVKFSQPAICCDVGDQIDLTQCGVQFSATSVMTASGITWSYEGKTVKSFTPSAKGVYSLKATSGGKTMTVYVVVKKAEESEYVLYRNNFDETPGDYRIVEQSNGSKIYASGGNLVLDASSEAGAYTRVLLPSYLDAFGDAIIEAGVEFDAAVDQTKWGSVMFRVQNGNYPYYHTLLRHNMTLSNAAGILKRNVKNDWDFLSESSFAYWNTEGSNICRVTLNGTESTLNLNGYDVVSYNNMEYANGAFGFQARGVRMLVDYIQITLDGNASKTTASDVSFAKPAIRADIGDTLDLTKCDVQLAVNTIYTKGNTITWKLDGKTITSFTPTKAGVTELTATSGKTTKKIYVVTRNLTDGEYVLYRNDFNSAPSDFRVIESTKSSAYYDGAGHYVLDASSSNTSYSRVLLPSFLDEFGDFKLEASIKDTNANTAKNWGSLMGRVQNGNYPYMQMCVRSNALQDSGVEFSQRNESNTWSVKVGTRSGYKQGNTYNTYSLVMLSHQAWGYINGVKTFHYRKNLYVTGAMGLQAKGMKLTVDYVKVTLGDNAAWEDTSMITAVAANRPAIGCNAGQTVLLTECDVQFTYGAAPIDGSQITWKKDGQVITEYSDTSEGMHTLTATHNGITRNIYIMAKHTEIDIYRIFKNDFTYSVDGWHVVEHSNGGQFYHDSANGYFVLDASGNKNSYVRVLLPSYLDEFSDAAIQVSYALTQPTDINKWASVMYRVQNRDYPYNHALIRYNPTVSSGVELAQRDPSNEWEVFNRTTTANYTPGTWNEVIVATYAKSTDVSVNNQYLMSYHDTPYANGSWGLQVRGAKMTVDWVRIYFTKNKRLQDLYVVSGKYADVNDVSSGISAAPAIITDVKTKAEFDDILNGAPAIAILNYKIVDGVARVVFNDGSVSPKEAVEKLASQVIPAFRVNDAAAADSLASFLIGQNMKDAYVVSAKPALVNRAYQKWKYVRGVVDYSARSGFDPEDLRYEALANGAKVLLLAENTSKETVTAIQDSYSCVWLKAGSSNTASVTAINKGPYGIVSADRAVTEFCYKCYYPMNTMVRRPNVIGHRGNPSTSQENTIAGASAAYSYGATAVENDIYLVADGVLMIMHDTTIDRTTNGSGSVTSYTSAQLKQFVVNNKSGVATQRIPSLEEYFKLIKGDKSKRLVVEYKQESVALVQPLKALIEKYDIMDQIVIIDFDKKNQNIRALREALPGIPVGWLNNVVGDESNPIASVQNVLERLQTDLVGFNPKFTGWGENAVREFIYRGVNIWPWTVNDQATFDKLMIAGVGGITTNYSQWASGYIENLYVDAGGQVITETYNGILTKVNNTAEFVLIEDTIGGVTYSNGTVKIPANSNGGHASYFFRYKATTPTGYTYYVVSNVVTVKG